MAEALLDVVTDIREAFADHGSLAFVHNGKELAWEWQGLVEALSAQIALLRICPRRMHRIGRRP